jgi:hypothetical protein
MSKHLQALTHSFFLMLEWVEKSVSQVALVDGSRVALDVVPEVFVWHLQDPREQSKESAVDGTSKVLGESGDLVHERMDAGRDLVDVLVLFVVEIELRYTIRFAFDRL